MNKCIGKTRVANCDWYVPLGKTPQDCTYCQFCYDHGCFTEEVIKHEKLNNCNCDCINPHEYIESYMCDKHKDSMFSCDIGHCIKCNHYTFSGQAKYCAGCSALDRVCEFCGEKEV